MRWLSPPDSVPEARASVRYSRPTSTQEAQPLADFLEHAAGDLVLLGGERVRQRREPFAGAPDDHLGDCADMRGRRS